MLETISRDLAGEVGLLLFGHLRLRREDLAHPFGDAANDLADAGLGDLVEVGLRAGRTAGDVDGVVNLEVAFGRWERD